MAGKSNFHANLPILDGKNWDTWVKQMKVIFIVQEADEQVNTIVDPLPTNATKQQRTTLREAQKKDSKALFLSHQCVDSKVFEKIADATTSKDAWDILHKSYGGDAKVKKVKLQALKRQFESLEMKNDEAVAEYFTRVETLTNQMKNCGSTLSEEEMVEKVLRTLTHKFDHIVVTIEQTKDLSEIKMEDLQSTLEVHELKHGERNHGKEDGQTLFVKFKKYQDEKKKWQKEKGSKKGKESVEDKPESSKKEGGQKTKKDKSIIQCYNCDKYGHYASECKAPKKKKSQNTEEEANVAQDASTSEDDVRNKCILTDFNKCLNIRIKLAKGQLLEKGFKTVFKGETLKLFDSKQRLILKTAQNQNRTFKTQVKTIEVECLATSNEDKDSDLWHIRYDHLNFKSLSMLNSKNMVLGLPNVIALVDTCTTCLLGKHPRSSFKSNLPMRSSEVLNVVHSDICGPIDVLSTGGNKYFITFVDEYSSDDDNRSHMTENDNGSDQGPLLMMPTTEDEFDVPSNILSIEQLVEKGFTLSLGNNQMKVYNVENKMVFCAFLSQSRTVHVEFENSNSEVLIEECRTKRLPLHQKQLLPSNPKGDAGFIYSNKEESDKSIKILRTDGASKHTSKESDSVYQKVHISEDVIMNEVHINEDSESDSNAEIDVEAPEAEVSAVEANVETRARSTKARESDVETDVEASEAEVSACALLVDKPVTKSKVMTDVGMISCFLRNKLLRTRGLMLHQKKYAGEILRRFNMVESKSAMEMNLKPENQRKEANCRIKVNNHGEDPTIIKKVARCLRYLYKSMPDICLVKGLCGYKVDRRSTSGYVFKFQNAPISWCSKKQSVIALSSCEAEDQVNKGKLSLEYCSTDDQQADILTKAVKRDQFLKLRREMRIVSFDSLN
ncbi:hypothetical protein TSUD_232360 [Trifolium subterraneum]|uniref:CCHC-type domain-containing protein n=1 Tax=Trifolium subterraneum TaxID=3900 RepID=A0A2Z6LJ14_TRISU|nr:hypothetical protein TSUD_232360 [Trifolium subterraneum]